MFCPLEVRLRRHFITFRQLEGNTRGHFTTFCLLEVLLQHILSCFVHFMGTLEVSACVRFKGIVAPGCLILKDRRNNSPLL